jgi:hypothetical protein
MDPTSEGFPKELEFHPTGFKTVVFLTGAFFFGATDRGGRMGGQCRSEGLVCSDPSLEDVADGKVCRWIGWCHGRIRRGARMQSTGVGHARWAEVAVDRGETALDDSIVKTLRGEQGAKKRVYNVFAIRTRLYRLR